MRVLAILLVLVFVAGGVQTVPDTVRETPVTLVQTHENLAAIFAYRQSLPPIENATPEPLSPEDIPS